MLSGRVLSYSRTWAESPARERKGAGGSWRCSLVVECLPRMCKTLGSIAAFGGRGSRGKTRTKAQRQTVHRNKQQGGHCDDHRQQRVGEEVRKIAEGQIT